MVALAISLGSFAWSFVQVSLPFHIQRMSTLDAAATLRWTGWIIGISSLVTVVTAPFWGRLARRRSPKTLLVIVQILQGVGFFGTALARTLVELFLSRFLVGMVGAVSTFAFVSAGRSADTGAVRRQVGLIQSGMTIGGLIGPLAGAVVAVRVGFRASFAVGGVILLACSGLVHWGIPPQAPLGERDRGAGWAHVGEIVAVALIVLIGSTQIFFLTSILPQVVSDLGVAADRTLEVGGLLIFVSGAGAAVGALLAGRLGEIMPERQLLVALLAGSAVLTALLGAVHSAWLYGIIRFLQVLVISPVFPVTVARVALRAGGEAIGFVNSARIGASFLGPVLATSMLASLPSPALYLLLAAMTIACVPLVSGRRAPLARWRHRSP